MPKRLLLTIILVAMSLSACVTAPVQEMSDARQAIAVAERPGSDASSSTQLIAAHEALARAEQSLHRFEFRDARKYAIEARQLALQAQQVSTR